MRIQADFSFGPRIAGTGSDGLICKISSLSEIEAAVEALSPSDQEILLEGMLLSGEAAVLYGELTADIAAADNPGSTGNGWISSVNSG